MSVFFLYFEKSNPNASWTEFQHKKEPVTETFTRVYDRESQLSIQSINVTLHGKVTESFIIHDGISSDRMLQSGSKNDPLISKQRSVLFNFIEQRLTNDALDHYFILHLYHEAVGKKDAIDYDGIAEIKLSDLKGFTIDVRRDVLYKVIG